jgi:phospholipase C
MQNSSFDHLFGTYSASSGNTVDGLRPGVPGYTQTDAAGKSVSPFLLTNIAPPALPEGVVAYTAVIDGGLMDKFAFNNGDISMGYYDSTTPGVSTLWGYAQQYALADRYFNSVIGEAPSNQLYMVAADDNNQPHSVQPFYGPCNLPDPAAMALTNQNVGDQLTQKGISWAAYQESLGNCSAYSPLHDPFQYFTSTHTATKDYAQFATDLSAGKLPAVSFIFPNNSNDMHPGFAPITNGITFLDTLVKELQASTVWSSTAIVVTFDDGGGWYDHVAPPTVDSQGLDSRVPMLVISPLAKQNYVSHVQMDHVSILRFIQNNWGLPSLNSRNSASNDISDMFK